MKIRSSLFALACALTVSFVTPAYVQAAEAETELGGHMEKMSSAFRALRRQIKDASKNADSLEKLATIKKEALASAKLDPALKSEKPAAEQAKFVAAYQARMKEFIALVEKTEAALKAGKNEEADALVAQMADAQKKGHGDFKKNSKKS